MSSHALAHSSVRSSHLNPHGTLQRNNMYTKRSERENSRVQLSIFQNRKGTKKKKKKTCFQNPRQAKYC